MSIVHNFNNTSKKNLSFLKSLLIVLLIISCSSNEELPDEKLIEKELYDQAQARMKGENYSSAIMSLETLESRFPFGRYAEQAQAELIFAYYRNSNFEASLSAAERFINLHPRHSHTGYAYYMKGLASFTDDSGLFSRYFQSDLAKREIIMAQKSFDELSDFISRYPESKYVPHAKQRMIYLRNLLAEHEIYVADFYMKRGAYLAAVGRAQYVIEHLPNTPQTPYALSILVEAYGILEYQELKETNLKVLNTNFPDFNVNQNLSVKKRSWANVLTFGMLGKENIEKPIPIVQ
ncbi:MAG TPA: outer membrane protein assembly factor BamD [SAR86 cluster bacterium]|nr:outer membrane protein assembly factor BamD [SAR86 cluster bacterium]HJM59354.1 outer membrane protein assembly factor BamD [SAR86 cluster bacterium]|tara:strand:- start:456 stop:1331 length:876 start_codon:yes stop_codon:yes gene_type:complete